MCRTAPLTFQLCGSRKKKETPKAGDLHGWTAPAYFDISLGNVGNQFGAPRRLLRVGTGTPTSLLLGVVSCASPFAAWD